MSVQIILKDGKPEWAVVPYEEYERLRAAAEMWADIREYDAVKEVLARGEEELIPAGVACALVDGANPIRVWRRHRGLTQAQLARAAGISPPYLSQLERGRRAGTTEVLARLAAALSLTLDDLISQGSSEDGVA